MNAAPKPTALEQYLAQRHRKGCHFWVFSGDRNCTCGRNAAIRELEEIKRNQPAAQPELFEKEQSNANA